MNDNSQADAGEGVGEDEHQQRGQDRSQETQQGQMQHQDEEVRMIIHEEIRGEDATGRGERRREFRRRMTLDPLVDLLDDGIFLDGGDNNDRDEADENDDEQDREGSEGTQEGSQEGIGMVIDAQAANNDGGDNATAGNRNDNLSELELLGELLGRYARNRSNRSGGDSLSSEGEDGIDNENNAGGPLLPPRNHSYLPTAQPLYPEEWIPAGQHRHRLNTGESDFSDLLREEFSDKDIDAEGKSEDDAGSDTSNREKSNDIDGFDREELSPSYYSIPIPGPPTLIHSRSKEKEHGILHDVPDMTPLQSENTADATTLAIMEMEDVVLFPGSVVPLRLRDRNWVTYLGQLIDDARGLYGSHQGTTRGMGEVRIVILPRLSPGTRRTRRRPREGGGRTGRWRVDLIRRGVTSIRSRLTRRRRRSESTETELNNNSSRNENESERSGQDEASMNVEEDIGTSQRQHSSDSSSSLEESEVVDLFHPTSAPRVPDDPLIGRIGTMATITFTHEENTSAANQDESLAGEPRHAHRPSSMVWRDRGEELVVTVLGTNRVRLIRSMKDDNSPQFRNIQIPLYAVEAIHDGSTALPPSWMLRPPGDIRCSIATPANEPSLANQKEGKDMEEGIDCTSERQSRHEVCGYSYNNSIGNLSFRSSVPAVAYQAMWPWILCRKIFNLIKENDEFQGLSKILPTAAGLCVASGDEHNDNIQATAADENSTPSSPIQFQVVDPSAFANWISSNMPLSQNDRLDLLEMICAVEQLRFVLKKLEDKKQETILRCKHCGAVISQMRHVFSVGGSEGTTGAYVNEHGAVHQTVTIRKVDSHSVVCMGQSSTKDSWFPGYSWTIAYCAICSDHLGWKFRRVSKSDEGDIDRPRMFWGFSSITTDNHVPPRRVSLHTQRALAALLQHDEDFLNT